MYPLASFLLCVVVFRGSIDPAQHLFVAFVVAVIAVTAAASVATTATAVVVAVIVVIRAFQWALSSFVFSGVITERR